MGRTEKYVIGLLESLLGPSDRVRRFAWARGDLSPRMGRAAMLPFDAVWEARKLIIEIDEEQHTQETAFFDKAAPEDRQWRTPRAPALPL